MRKTSRACIHKNDQTWDALDDTVGEKGLHCT